MTNFIIYMPFTVLLYCKGKGCMVVLTVYGGAHSLWWCSQFMVVLTFYGGAHSLWWCSQVMVVLIGYGGAHRL